MTMSRGDRRAFWVTRGRSRATNHLVSACLLSLVLAPWTTAQDDVRITNPTDILRPSGLVDLEYDPTDFFRSARQRSKESLLPYDPLGEAGLEEARAARDAFFKRTGFRVGAAFTSVYQRMSDSLPGTEREGYSSDLDVYVSFAPYDRGLPTQGQFDVQFEGRWAYGEPSAGELGPANLGSVITTVDSFDEYTPAFLMRNAYWNQGTQESGFVWRVGKITPDGLIGTSYHLNPNTTFMPSGYIGVTAVGAPDSGLGIGAAWYPDDRFSIMGLISDSNGDRRTLGEIHQGDFFKAVEFRYKIAPKTEQAGYSKLAFWHNDGTDDGKPNNLSSGKEGWGGLFKYEQELTDDGDVIFVGKYGASGNDSAFYEHQLVATLLMYDIVDDDPGDTDLRNDLFGVGMAWADPVLEDASTETALETFYRFPLIPNLETTLSLQHIFNPALGSETDGTWVFGIRTRMRF